MPIYSQDPAPILDVQQAFDRLAFRCSLQAQLVGDVVTDDSSMSLHVTRYRKPAVGVMDVCGLTGLGEVGAVLSTADPDERALIQAVALISREHAGVAGDCAVSLAFAWRPEQGDVVGMATQTVTPVEGAPVSDSCGNTDERMATDPAFAAQFAATLGQIAQWCALRGW